MHYPLVGHLGLVPLCEALLVATVAAWCGIVLCDPVARSQGLRRYAWTSVATGCLGFGIWSAQRLVGLAIVPTVAISFRINGEISSLFDSTLLCAAVFYFSSRRPLLLRHAIIAGIALGLAIDCCQILQLASLRSEAALSINIPSFVFTLIAVLLCSLSGIFVHHILRIGYEDKRPLLEAIVGILLGAMITGAPVAVYLTTRVDMTSPAAASVPAGSNFDAGFLAAVNVLLSVAAVTADRLEELAMQESRRAHLYNDLYLRERHINSTLQQAFLPATLPSVPGVEFSCVYLPQSEESRIGGDWYDAFELPNGWLGISIGDVLGHGIPAALTMGVVRQAIRCSALLDDTPTSVLQSAHHVLITSDYPAIVSAAFATFSPHTLEVVYAFAGHPPAMVVSAAHEVRRLEYGGLALGIDDDLYLSDRSTVLDPGGMLVFYTDGCIEYNHDVESGEQRLREAISAVHRGLIKPPGQMHSCAQEIAQYLFAETGRRDDAAILCLSPANESQRKNIT